MQNSLLNYFSKNNLIPRETQTNCLNWLNDNLNSAKYFILQLPTGVGKTHIGLALSEFNKKNLYISSTNQLLTQYLDSNKDLVEMKGKAQYQCNVDASCNCLMGPCKTNSKIKEHCLSEHLCEYYNIRDRFIIAKMGLTNYAFAVASTGCGIFSEDWAASQDSERLNYDYIVCDEAHNLESHLVNFATININLEELMQKNVIGDTYYVEKNNDSTTSWTTILDVCNNIFTDITKRLKFLEGKINTHTKKDNKIELKKLHNEYQFLTKLQFPIKILLEYPQIERWVYEADVEAGQFKITPINVEFVFKQYLETLGKKFIFMSATIGDYEVFVKSLGLNKNECKYYQCDSPFDPKKSPVILLERLNLNYNNIDKELDKCLKYVEGIAIKHNDTNGIIHSGNYKIAKYIYDNASEALQKRLVYREKYDNVNNTELINIHRNKIKNNINSVLLSPSLFEGVDLADDLSRWQIIIKLPFASLADKRIKHLATIFPTWYVNDVLKKIIQACGRSTRHNEDYSRTYILDKITSFTFSKVKLPLWFQNRIIIK
jgi:ATP-dependent DNA helicase DinG